jgi:hypothetical protein
VIEKFISGGYRFVKYGKYFDYAFCNTEHNVITSLPTINFCSLANIDESIFYSFTPAKQITLLFGMYKNTTVAESFMITSGYKFIRYYGKINEEFIEQFDCLIRITNIGLIGFKTELDLQKFDTMMELTSYD